MLKMLVLLSFWVLYPCLLASQERTDSVCTFCFLPGENTFYLSHGANQKELERLLAFADRYKTTLADNPISIYVDGYCYSLPTVKANLAVARIRSNRVKSELITRKGLKESNFLTRNHAGRSNPPAGAGTDKTDRVIVRINIPAPEPAPSLELPMLPDTPVQPRHAALTTVFRLPVSTPLYTRLPDKDTPPRFALKTNLLYAAALLINAEAEYYLKKRLSLNIDWQYAWWSSRSKHKYYRLAAISPELRYWFASRENFRGHFGGFYVGTGLYEFMARPTHGIQGEFFIAGGLTYGYMFPIGRRLRLELSVGVGYLMTEYRQYHWDRGCYVYEKTQRYSYFGPTKAKVSLVWPLNRFGRKPRIET